MNELEAQVMLAGGTLPDVRLFRNTVGEGWTGEVVERRQGHVILAHARHVTFGLHPGSADVVGWRRILVTPDLVGATVAQFIGLEAKSGSGRLSPAQRTWLDVARSFGALAEVVRSPEAARALLLAPPGQLVLNGDAA